MTFGNDNEPTMTLLNHRFWFSLILHVLVAQIDGNVRICVHNYAKMAIREEKQPENSLKTAWKLI